MPELFSPLKSSDKAGRLLKSARKHNQGLDKIDNHSLHRGPIDAQARTAISAIVCGLETESWDCVAQGCCILQDAEARLRSLPAVPGVRRAGI